MVVRRVDRFPAIIYLFFAAVLMLVPRHDAVSAPQTGIHPALLPRFVLIPSAESPDPGLRVVLDAAMQAVMNDERALWFTLPRENASFGEEPADVLITSLADEAWTRHQAEVLVFLNAQDVESRDDPVQRNSTLRVQAHLYRVRPAGSGTSSRLEFWEREVQIDAAGRYLRPDTWRGLVAAIMEHADTARPVVELTVDSDGPVEISGLPEWAEVRQAAAGRALVRLRSLREYSFTVSRPGYRPQYITVYMERTPVRLRVDLTPYPRHTIAATVRGLSWPGLEYGWYHARTNWTARLGVTSFLFGVTPLRQVRNETAEARIISSYGLSEVELGVHWLFNDRDQRHRMSAGAGGVVRLVHGNVAFGVDPAIPWAVRPALGWEWEMSRRLILSQGLTTDLFLSPRPTFVRGEVWLHRMGPVFWQLPVYRAGLRVRL